MPLSERLDLQAPPVGRLSKREEEKLLSELADKKGSDALDTGDMVEIPKYGEAQVIGVNGDKVDVVLPDGEEKTFKADYLDKLGS